MTSFTIAVILAVGCVIFVLASFLTFLVHTNPRIQIYSKLYVVLEFCCRSFLVLSAVCGALAVLVVMSWLVTLTIGVIEP